MAPSHFRLTAHQRRFIRTSFILLSLSCLGCTEKNETTEQSDTGETDQKNTGPINNLEVPGAEFRTGLSVSPLNPFVELDLNEGAEVEFKATWAETTTSIEDVTNEVTWSISPTPDVRLEGSKVIIAPQAEAGARSVDILATDSNGNQATARLTIAVYKKSGEQPDFFFSLPQTSPEDTQPLAFSTDVQDIDVFINMDTTSSMGPSIAALQNDLSSTIIPNISSQLRSAWFGVGAFEDFPGWYGDQSVVDGIYGNEDCDQPFELLQEMTSDVTLALEGVAQLSQSDGQPIGCGGSGPESLTESLLQIATGRGLMGPRQTFVAPNSSGVGGVGFREGTLPIIVAITDWPSHNGALPQYDYAHDEVTSVAATYDEALSAIGDLCGRVVTVGNDREETVEELTQLATATGSLVPPQAWSATGARPPGCAEGECCTGSAGAGEPPNTEGLCPLSFLGVGLGNDLTSSIVTGIDMLTRFSPFDTEIRIIGESTSVDGVPLPDGVTTADFIDSVTPASFKLPTTPPGLPEPESTASGFNGVTPGTEVRFDVLAKNDIVENTETAQFFKAKLQVVAGGCFPVDEREVLIVVPPEEVTGIVR